MVNALINKSMEEVGETVEGAGNVLKKWKQVEGGN